MLFEGRIEMCAESRLQFEWLILRALVIKRQCEQSHGLQHIVIILYIVYYINVDNYFKYDH